MTTQHTPGPWKLRSWRDHLLGRGVDVIVDDRIVAECRAQNGAELASCEADAALISAAPDLETALANLLHTRGRGCNCKNVVAVCGVGHTCDECAARAALAKACGKAVSP